jgi:DNA-binding transcriptional ArsR family regulator
MDELTSLAHDFKALGHPARLAILDALRDGEQCVCHLESMLGYRQAYISQQLALLKEIGIVKDRRDGWNIFYLVSRPEIFTVVDAARAIPSAHRKFPTHRPARSFRCPCPKCRPDAERIPAGVKPVVLQED